MEPYNMARCCPVCKKEPKQEVLPANHYCGIFLPESIVLRCHGYVAEGATLLQATEHWNKFISFQSRQVSQKALESPITPKITSHCLYCGRDTEGRVFDVPARYYVQCKECHLVKYEGKPKPKHEKINRLLLPDL